jgi:hypothetical protein
MWCLLSTKLCPYFVCLKRTAFDLGSHLGSSCFKMQNISVHGSLLQAMRPGHLARSLLSRQFTRVASLDAILLLLLPTLGKSAFFLLGIVMCTALSSKRMVLLWLNPVSGGNCLQNANHLPRQQETLCAPKTLHCSQETGLHQLGMSLLIRAAMATILEPLQLTSMARLM